MGHKTINSKPNQNHKKMIKKVIISIASLALLGGALGLYLYNQPKDDINDLKADQVLSAEKLANEYTTDEAQADKTYLGKVLEVTGKVLQIEEGEFNVVTLEGSDLSSVRAQLLPEVNVAEFKGQEYLTIKGKCAGTLLDVTLNDCIILK
jgi:hypothetical protein